MLICFSGIYFSVHSATNRRGKQVPQPWQGTSYAAKKSSRTCSEKIVTSMRRGDEVKNRSDNSEETPQSVNRETPSRDLFVPVFTVVAITGYLVIVGWDLLRNLTAK